MPVCSECGEVMTSLTALRLHSKVIHFKDRNRKFKCGESGCYRVYSNWEQFKKHYLKEHDVNSVINNASNTAPSAQKECLSMTSETDCISADSPISSTEACASSTSSTKFNFKKEFNEYVMRYVGKLYANHQLPRNFVQMALDDTSDLINSLISCLKPALEDLLRNNAVDDCVISIVHSHLNKITDPFLMLRTEHRRFRALKDSGCFIPKQDHVIGFCGSDKVKDGVMVRKNDPVHAKYLPMRLVLEKVFSLPGVYAKTKSYMTEMMEDPDVLENFVQGQLWRDKVSKHFPNKTVFPLFIYFDDFEVNNPLGSHSGIHKIGGVYYSVACFPPDVMSQVENIFSAMFVYSYDRAEFKNSKVFNIIVDELNYLQQEGIVVNTEHGEEIIYFALGLVSGDNLGLNSVLGFVEGFTAKYCCRLCTVSNVQARIDFDEKCLRTESYQNDVSALDPKASGIKEKSIWDQVNFFSTPENYFSDWLHEGPEGQAGLDMELILHYYTVTKKVLSLQVLNSRMRSFNYADNSISNRPPLVSEDEVKSKSLKMSASEMQNFILMFSMLVSDIVPHDAVWQFYLILRQIVDIVLSRRVRKGCGAFLRGLVKEHHTLFNQLFVDSNLKFKGHLWVHYGTILEQSGPLINLSTARFESKHKKKKTEANATSSRRDIIETLCIKEQLVMCYRFLTKRGFTQNNREGPCECVENVNMLSNFHSFKNTLPASFYKPCLLLNWVAVNGQTYKTNTCLIIRLVETGGEVLPIFGVVNLILQNDKGEICLVFKLMETVGFDLSVHAYEVSHTEQLECLLVEHLHSPFAVILHTRVNICTYATLRHGI